MVREVCAWLPRRAWFGQQFAGRQGQLQEALLPGRRAHRGAQFLVGVIIDTQCIPVRQQHGFLVEHGDHRIGQQATAGTCGELLAPAGSPDCRAARSRAHRDPVSCRRPAQIRPLTGSGSSSPIQASNRSPRMYSTRACAASCAQKGQEALIGCGGLRVQMQVGDEQFGQWRGSCLRFALQLGERTSLPGGRRCQLLGSVRRSMPPGTDDIPSSR